MTGTVWAQKEQTLVPAASVRQPEGPSGKQPPAGGERVGGTNKEARTSRVVREMGVLLSESPADEPGNP